MIYSRNSIWNNGFLRDCSAGWEGILAIVIGIPVITFLEMTRAVKIWQWSHQQYSLADCLITMHEVINLGMMLIPFIVFASFYIFRYENRAEIVIKSKKRSKIWNQIMIKRIFLACLVSAYIMVFEMLFGMLMSNRYINWDEKVSLFATKTDGVTRSIGFLAVVILCYVVYVLKLCFMFFISALLEKKYVVLGIVIGIPGIEYFCRDVPVKLFYKLAGLSYQDWVCTKNIVIGILWLLTLCTLVWAAGMYRMKKKDFYG